MESSLSVTATSSQGPKFHSKARRRLSELRAAIQIHAQCGRDDELGASLREFTLLKELVEDAEGKPALWPMVEKLSRASR